MSEVKSPVDAFKPKKSVALSGVVAGNTALCTVGRNGNDLHYRGYDILDVAGFRHFRIDHSTAHVAAGHNHINGIENFWSQAKRHLRRYNGIPRAHFHLFLKECEWRFNERSARQRVALLTAWAGLED